jgi:hypothetical protein
MEGLRSHKQMFLLLHSQLVSAHMGHHQVIREEYTNDKGYKAGMNLKIG